jgi:hypothetical protein
MTEDELKSNSYQNSDLLYEDKDKLELARREDGNIELQLIYSHEMRAVPRRALPLILTRTRTHTLTTTLTRTWDHCRCRSAAY